MNKLVLLASASIIAMSSSAFAGDLPSKKAPPAVAPVQAAASWTGCYGGLNGGFASQSTKTSYEGTDEGSNTGEGGAFGGQLGCDYQSGNVVFGIQGLVDWTDLSGSNEYTDNEGGVLTTDARWFATLTGRLGYTIQPETLLYVKGGLAWINNRFVDDNGLDRVGDTGWSKNGDDSQSTASATKTLNGWVLGAGLEHKYTSNLSVFAESNYLDFGSHSVEVSDGTFSWTNESSNHVSVALVGLNYRF